MLPVDFVESITAELGAHEAQALCRALDTPSPTAVRLNPLKMSRWRGVEQTTRVPWCSDGYYLESRPQFTLDSAFHAGAYYVQEPSSQFVGHLLSARDMQGARLLDLCAAPGGKSTLYSTLVGRDGLVVANEIDHRRAQVLADNVRKWGMGNVVVTCNDASRLAQAEQWFDVVAVDAPCSGEGMFRKDIASREEWSLNNVKLCSSRQDEILRHAWSALKAGGVLIYSTCTFNRSEDEGTLERFLAEFGDEVESMPRVKCPEEWGVECGEVGAFATYRFFPHKAAGEGFFAAVACKAESARCKVKPLKSRRTIFSQCDKATVGELSRWVVEPEKMRFMMIGDLCYGYRAEQVEAVKMLSESLSVITSGVEMGQIFKGRLRPEHGLAMYVDLNRGAMPIAELVESRALDYLRKRDISAEGFEQGINLVSAEGLAIGFAKCIGARVNNMYPNSLRIMNK